MGLYINPPNSTKEEWLEKNGLKIPDGLAAQRTLLPPEGMESMVVVCLLDNRPTLPFTAAGVAYDYNELQRFARPDTRKQTWYWVEKELVLEVTGGPNTAYELEIPYKVPKSTY
jgi:hypothetical protein